MDHEGRRVGARRMRKAQLRRAAAHRRRRVGFHRDFQRPVDLGRAQHDGGRVVGIVDGAEQLAQPRAVQRADAHRLRPRHERQLALQQRLGLVALVGVQAVPLVDRDHQRAARIQHRAQHARVLVGHALAGVEHHHRYLALLDRLQGLDDGKGLDRLVHLRLAADAGGVHQPVLAALALQVRRDRVAGGARDVGGDHPLLAQQPVDQGGLAHVGAADERQAHPLRVVVQLLGLTLLRQPGEDPLHQRVDAMPVRGRHREAVLEAVAGELRQRRARVEAVGLVDHQHHRPAALAQPLHEFVVQARRAFAAVHHQQHQVGLRGGGAGLARGGARQPFLDAGDAAGVHQQERALRIDPADAVVAVAGHARLIVHQRVAAAGEHVEQRRFADVGATCQGDEGKHGHTPPAVTAAAGTR